MHYRVAPVIGPFGGSDVHVVRAIGATFIAMGPNQEMLTTLAHQERGEDTGIIAEWRKMQWLWRLSLKSMPA